MSKPNKVNISFALPVSILKEGKYFIAYTPVLDLSTSGETLAEVKRRFNEVVQIFFEEVMEKGTLDEVLAGLGWQKLNKNWTPPTFVAQESTKFTLPLLN